MITPALLVADDICSTEVGSMGDLLNTFPDGCSLHLGDVQACMHVCWMLLSNQNFERK